MEWLPRIRVGSLRDSEIEGVVVSVGWLGVVIAVSFTYEARSLY